MNILSKELSAISAKSPFDRYQYSIKRIVGQEEAWTLVAEDNSFAIAEVGGHHMVSLWPVAELAQEFCTGAWARFKPVKVSLDALDEEIFEVAEAEDLLLNVFPLPDRSGFVVSVAEILRDLNAEIDKYG